MTALRWRSVAALVAVMWSVTACAQTPKPAAPAAPPAPPAPPAAPSPSPSPASPPLSDLHLSASDAKSFESTMLPFDRIDRPILLDDEMEAIRRAIPAFNCVIVRDPGVAKSFPTIPAMTLKNISLGQFLQFLQASFPGLQYKRIDGPSGALYAVRVRMEDDPLRRAWAMDRSRVRLFRLNEFINTLADQSPDTQKPRDLKIKEATNQLLSLLQAALEQTDDQEPCIVKIHEPTLTLMFKGSQEKQAVLEEALSALAPPGSAASKTIRDSSRKGAWDFSYKDSNLADLDADLDRRASDWTRALKDRTEQMQVRIEQQAAERAQRMAERDMGGKPKPSPAPSPVPTTQQQLLQQD